MMLSVSSGVTRLRKPVLAAFAVLRNVADGCQGNETSCRGLTDLCVIDGLRSALAYGSHCTFSSRSPGHSLAQAQIWPATDQAQNYSDCGDVALRSLLRTQVRCTSVRASVPVLGSPHSLPATEHAPERSRVLLHSNYCHGCRVGS